MLSGFPSVLARVFLAVVLRETTVRQKKIVFAAEKSFLLETIQFFIAWQSVWWHRFNAETVFCENTPILSRRKCKWLRIWVFVLG